MSRGATKGGQVVLPALRQTGPISRIGAVSCSCGQGTHSRASQQGGAAVYCSSVWGSEPASGESSACSTRRASARAANSSGTRTRTCPSPSTVMPITADHRPGAFVLQQDRDAGCFELALVDLGHGQTVAASDYDEVRFLAHTCASVRTGGAGSRPVLGQWPGWSAGRRRVARQPASRPGPDCPV